MIKKFILTLFFCGFVFSAQAENGVNIFDTPRDAPLRKIKSQTGQNFSLSDFKGDFLLVLFWSRNCGPCIKELKSLNKFYNTVKNQGIKLILVSPSKEWQGTSEQRKFLKKYGAPDLDFYVDENGLLAGDFGIFTSPHVVLINKNGEEIGRIRGSAKWDSDDVIAYIYKLKAKYGG